MGFLLAPRSWSRLPGDAMREGNVASRVGVFAAFAFSGEGRAIDLPFWLSCSDSPNPTAVGQDVCVKMRWIVKEFCVLGPRGVSACRMPATQKNLQMPSVRLVPVYGDL